MSIQARPRLSSKSVSKRILVFEGVPPSSPVLEFGSGAYVKAAHFPIVGILLLFTVGGDRAEEPKLPVAASLSLLSIEDIVSMRRLQTVQISSDGSQVAFVVEEPNDESHSKHPTNTEIRVVAADGGAPRQYTHSPGKDSSPQWSPDGRTLSFLSVRQESAGSQIYFMDAEGKETRPLTRHATSISSFSWSPDGKRIAFLASAPENQATQRRLDLGDDDLQVQPSGPDQPPKPQKLWSLDVGTSEVDAVDLGELQIHSVQWSPDGTQFLLTVTGNPLSDPEGLRPRLVTVKASGGTPVVYCATRGRVSGASWSPDGKSIAFLASSQEGMDPYPGALYVCRGEGGEPQNLISGKPFTVESFRWLPDGQSLLLIIAEGAHRSMAKMSLPDGKLVRLTNPPQEVAFRSSYSVSRDGKRIACILSSSHKPPDVWVVSAGAPPQQLTRLNPALETRAYGESEEVRWKARDGLEITGVWIKPIGYRLGQRYPMVVQVHGSQVADTNEFQASWMNWGQLLAANGYAVLLPNYRGSLTNGARFARANQGDLGGKDFTDILDGVEAMIRQGVADPDRLGIGGVSYGGFLSAWAITQTPKFKAAVMGIGLSNWISMAGQTPGAEGMVIYSWIHSPYENPQLLWDRSPLAHVKNAKTPTLIYSGERDPLVPVSQGREFFRGLRHFGIPSEFIIYPREGHSIQEPNHLKGNLKRIVAWFDKYLKTSP